ncbi:MAG: GntR family transcriptional regulator [Chloroflexota bacterium]
MSTYKTDPNNPLPLYYQVYNSLRERIESGEFKPGDALPPERQLGTEYDVSRITIVKALDTLVRDNLIEKQQGRGTFVLDQNKEQLDRQLRLGYMPAVLLHPYFYSIQMGIMETIAEDNCELQVIGLLKEQRKHVEAIVQNVDESVDGLLVYPRPNKLDLQLCQRLAEEKIPFVMIDRYYDEIAVDSVTFDDQQASYNLTQLLIERGHRRIGIVCHFEVNVSSIRSRMSGYTKCLEDHNLPVDDSLIWLDVYANLRPAIGQKGDESMTENLRQLIDTYQPTALIAVNQDVSQRLTYDIMMLNHQRAQNTIRSNGSHDYELSIELTAFGHNSPEDEGPYHIATALQPGELLGRHATQLLLKRMRGEIGNNAFQRVQVPIEILIRHDLPNQFWEVQQS